MLVISLQEMGAVVEMKLPQLQAALSRSSAHAPAFNRILPGQSRLRHETGAGLFRTQKHRSHGQIHQNGGNTL